ncbi:HD domain-containing protein [Clostridium ihumii]|uniref:HD domain-containing protein n=1 Tax=Clostridium ihumii TaxID=1470356 RepID=UPI00058E33A0|nr:HD domain-containing protein [Clostridium ihumii]
MKKIELIINNETFKKNLKKLQELEKNRVFCKHGIEHSLDVARIAYIMVLENNLKIDKEIIYGAALLHDLGRVLQYEENIPHEEGSLILGKIILKECNYCDEDIDMILNAIKFHRKEESKSELGEILYKSDKLSRMCFACKSELDCYWDKKKKNFIIKY